MSGGKKCKIVRVKNRLAGILRSPGGISRTEAVTAATASIESLREEYVKLIPLEIAALETIVAEAGADEIDARDIERLLDRAGRLLTLSGTFGYSLLDAVAKCFCDLAAGMIEKGITCTGPITVHLRAMRLVCPGSPALAEAESRGILDELLKIHAHFGLTPHGREDAFPSIEGNDANRLE
ncbi:MAG TPA: hypothetical protein VGC27_07385 [Rhizomicrobium sp.]